MGLVGEYGKRCAELLDPAEPGREVFETTSSRGFTIFTGRMLGVPVSIISTGTGWVATPAQNIGLRAGVRRLYLQICRFVILKGHVVLRFPPPSESLGNKDMGRVGKKINRNFVVLNFFKKF